LPGDTWYMSLQPVATGTCHIDPWGMPPPPARGMLDATIGRSRRQVLAAIGCDGMCHLSFGHPTVVLFNKLFKRWFFYNALEQVVLSLREQDTTPTAQSYADGFLSGPSA
jgi:hypothetical protein